MKVLIDTNVLIDYISLREPFTHDAEKILSLCKDKKIQGCIAAHSIMNAFYILRKQFSVDERRDILKGLSVFLTVIGIDEHKITASLENYDFADIEDCLQTECAKDFLADYIVTRNIKDFQNSMIPPILPDEFLKMVN